MSFQYSQPSNVCSNVQQFMYMYIYAHCDNPMCQLVEPDSLNPLTAKSFNLNLHPLEVVSRRRDLQLQVSENYSDLTKWRTHISKAC